MLRSFFLSILSLASLTAALTQSYNAMAQGLFAGSKGARVAGRGGAYGAKADDLAAVEYNPAGLTHLGTTTLQLSDRISYNTSSYQRAPAYENVNGTGEIVQFDKVKNGQPWQALDPLLGVGSNFGTKDFAAAFVAYAPPGAARMSFPIGGKTDLPSGGQRYMMLDRDAEILIYALSAAYKFKEIFGVGATAQWIAVPRLNYSLVVTPDRFNPSGTQVRSNLDMVSHVKAKDMFTMNAILGAWVRPIPSVEIALSGQILPSAIHAKGSMAIETAYTGAPVVTSRNGVPADDVQLNIPLPMWARLAGRYVKKQGDEFKYDIELDLTYTTWSRVKAFDLNSNGLDATLTSAGTIPVGDVQIPKNWKNGLNIQLGGDFVVLPQVLTLRAGGGYETAISDTAYSHVDFATGQFLSGAVGASVYLGHVELAVAYSYRGQLRTTTTAADGKVYQVMPGNDCVAPYTDLARCPAPGQPAPTVNAGSYSASNQFLNLDVLYRF